MVIIFLRFVLIYGGGKSTNTRYRNKHAKHKPFLLAAISIIYKEFKTIYRKNNQKEVNYKVINKIIQNIGLLTKESDTTKMK
jgi:hypothetical protein